MVSLSRLTSNQAPVLSASNSPSQGSKPPAQPTSPAPRDFALSNTEMPANGGLLRICGRSPDSKFSQFQGEIADSLRRIFEIFPFLGDGGRRPGPICTAWPARQSYSRISLLIVAENRESSSATSSASLQVRPKLEQCYSGPWANPVSGRLAASSIMG